MRLVILESPYSDRNGHPVAENIAYAEAAAIDCLERNESPLASHLLFTRPGLLDDNEPWERMLGIQAGHAWITVADAMVVYQDLGISEGMAEGIRVAQRLNRVIEYRTIHFKWKEPPDGIEERVQHSAAAEELGGGGSAPDGAEAGEATEAGEGGQAVWKGPEVSKEPYFLTRVPRYLS